MMGDLIFFRQKPVIKQENRYETDSVAFIYTYRYTTVEEDIDYDTTK